MNAAGVFVRDVLGNERPVARTWEDGSWACPFCSNAVAAARGETACGNPWCVANPAMPLEVARKIYADAERKRNEDESRARDHRVAMERIEQDQLRREREAARVREQAEERGACVFCACRAHAQGRPVKYTKHRGACPARRPIPRGV